MNKPLLSLDHLSVTFHAPQGDVTPVPDVTLNVMPAERVALVGESGCGKSVTALSITRLPPADRANIGGALLFDGVPIKANNLQELRRKGIAYVFQDPIGSLNPVMRIGEQINENLPGLGRKERRERAIQLLEDVGLPEPARILSSYACELSGGQCQRVMLAMALAADPKLLIADEPTTALDVTTQQRILELITKLAEERHMAVLLITHNLGIVAKYMQRLYVMYAGRIVEHGTVKDVFTHARHPYTRGLLAAVPSLHLDKKHLQDIPGTVPPPGQFPPGCTFAPRCAYAKEECLKRVPELKESNNFGVRCIFSDGL